MTYVHNLSSVLETNAFKNGAIKQHDLVDSFNCNFKKEKYRWNKMIEDRLNSCSCFRSNVFKGLGLDSKGGHSKKTA